MTESKLYEKLTKIKKYRPVEFCRIETGHITIAIPDVYYFDPETTGFIELKIIKYKRKIKLYVLDYRPGQISWLSRHRRANKYTFTLGWYDGFYYLFDMFFEAAGDIDGLCIWKGESLVCKELYKLLFRNVK